MYLKYNSLEKQHKMPFGAMKKGEQLTITVLSDADKVILHGFEKPIEMEKNGEEFSCKIIIEKQKGLYFYSFEAVDGDKENLYGRGFFGDSEIYKQPYQLTVHENKSVPDWFKNSTMYQIYVDRFYAGDNTDCTMRDNVLLHSSWDDKPIYIRKKTGEIVSWDFFGGNIAGVIEKLDYLYDFGVDIIYLNPIFEASSNHKYDTADYTKVDRMYGNEKTLKRLVDEAKKRGMHIMLDGVFSHTGDDSIYFNRFGTYGKTGAYQDKHSPYYSWFDFKEYPEKYDCWWGVKALPCTNELDPSFLNYLLNDEDGAVAKWMKLGISGWRLDVADELPDEFIAKLKQCVLKVNPSAVLLGEVWEDASNKVSYDSNRQYILGDSLDSVSNYPLRDGLMAVLKNEIGPADFGNDMTVLYENYPKDIFASLMNMTGTHDTTRLFSILGGAPAKDSMDEWEARTYRLSDEARKLAFSRLYLYFLAIYTLPGNPCIYYGDEICLEGYEDPYNRGTYDWSSENTQMIEFIKQLASIRKSIKIDNCALSFIDTNSFLGYSLCSEGKKYSVYINPYDIDVALDIKAENVVLNHDCDIKESSVIIKAGGAIIIQN